MNTEWNDLDRVVRFQEIHPLSKASADLRNALANLINTIAVFTGLFAGALLIHMIAGWS